MELPMHITLIPPQALPSDSVFTEVPEAPPTPLESVMLSHDRIYVVLAVVLIIWFGVLYFLFRTDRKIDRLTEKLQQCLPPEHSHIEHHEK